MLGRVCKIKEVTMFQRLITKQNVLGAFFALIELPLVTAVQEPECQSCSAKSQISLALVAGTLFLTVSAALKLLDIKPSFNISVKKDLPPAKSVPQKRMGDSYHQKKWQAQRELNERKKEQHQRKQADRHAAYVAEQIEARKGDEIARELQIHKQQLAWSQESENARVAEHARQEQESKRIKLEKFAAQEQQKHDQRKAKHSKESSATGRSIFSAGASSAVTTDSSALGAGLKRRKR
jgi:hypothetical protein